jgi:2',3'-cyclic-nucleotide 2'-phosphodiesterase (5'-nucleotidase family)
MSISLNKRCNFQWLCSNLHNSDGSNIGGSEDFTIIERPGWKIGVIGLAEFAWVTTVTCLDIDNLIFEDYIEASHKLVNKLSKSQKTALKTN